MRKYIPFRNIGRTIPILLILVILSCKVNSQITVEKLQEHIKYLSSDALVGRLTGSPGDSLAALYIRNKLSSYGLKPLTGDGFQRFKVTKRVVAGKDNHLSINGIDYLNNKDFMPFSFSSNNGLESDVVFTGYGFNINSDSLKWNDYDGVDVKGKWVMILRGDPEPE
ncbi:MAG TPA: hypothetical protein VFE71_09060, partial [Bacteroidales bacterium]|nr:hypothetical protein [Bacteroidales bacterium]